MNNLNDGLAWGILPLFFAGGGLGIEAIGWIAALYPATWGAGRSVTGALSDRVGQKWPIATGMWLQGLALVGLRWARASSPGRLQRWRSGSGRPWCSRR